MGMENTLEAHGHKIRSMENGYRYAIRNAIYICTDKLSNWHKGFELKMDWTDLTRIMGSIRPI